MEINGESWCNIIRTSIRVSFPLLVTTSSKFLATATVTGPLLSVGTASDFRYGSKSPDSKSFKNCWRLSTLSIHRKKIVNRVRLTSSWLRIGELTRIRLSEWIFDCVRHVPIRLASRQCNHNRIRSVRVGNRLCCWWRNGMGRCMPWPLSKCGCASSWCLLDSSHNQRHSMQWQMVAWSLVPSRACDDRRVHAWNRVRNE